MSITIEQMNEQVATIAALRAEEEQASRAKKEVTERLEAAEARMLEMLTDSGMTNYRSPLGLVTVAFRTSVKTPKTPAEKELFHNWLRAQGLYDQLISVNSQTLNSLYKSELEKAKERGDTDFAIPGIDGVTIAPQLRFSRG